MPKSNFLVCLAPTIVLTFLSITAFAEDIEADIDSLVSNHFSEGHSPALSIKVVFKGETLYENNLGYIDLEHSLKPDSDSVYRVGSVTKEFTAASILQLVNQSKLKLDDPVNQYLPYQSDRWKDITVRNLLNHSSGIPNYTAMEIFGEKATQDLSHQQLVDLFIDKDLEFSPGDQWKYSNSGYYLLGLIIESVSGESYENYLQKNIFDKLSLRDTYYCDETKLIPGRASGYQKEGEQWVNAKRISMQPPFSAGGLCSSVNDLVKWRSSLVVGKVVPDQYYNEMVTSGLTNDGEPLGYGLGFRLEELKGLKKIVHGGGINGFIAYDAHYPEIDLYIVALTNSYGKPYELGPEIENRVIQWNQELQAKN